MITRYQVEDVAQIWSDENKFTQLLNVERALLKVLESKKVIPAGTTAAFSAVLIRPDRIQEIENTTRHDVIAFCTSITEQVNPDFARFFHYGVTSSDVIDTALSLQIRESIEVVVVALQGMIQSLNQKVIQTQSWVGMGRSHGMSAEPMIFAQKFLSVQVELQRRLQEYEAILQHGLSGQTSGAVGNYTVLDPEIEAEVMKELGLRVEPVSTQVIPRDHLAAVITLGARTAVALERYAVELRHLHHSDIAELHEGFKPGQKGSSTMPHKKNPIASENITGLSRVIRSQVSIALENTVLWHERDISHSSAERLMLPDHFGLLVYMLRRMTDTTLNLELHQDVIESKVKKNFQSWSSAILHQLIRENSVPREQLYALVQAAAFQSNSLDEMLSKLESELVKQKLNGNLKSMNWEKLCDVYRAQFQKVLKRCN
jgi:adenylosuccinate lyase